MLRVPTLTQQLYFQVYILSESQLGSERSGTGIFTVGNDTVEAPMCLSLGAMMSRWGGYTLE